MAPGDGIPPVPASGTNRRSRLMMPADPVHRVRAGVVEMRRNPMPAPGSGHKELHRVNVTAGFVIFTGAGFGALLRWALGHSLNPVFPAVPLGTLAANVLGGLLMGLALGAFNQFEAIPPTVRLAMTTGFLGGLTTFSTFSAESVTLLLRGEYRWMAVHVALHVIASLLATLAGMALVRALSRTLGGSP